MCVILKGPYVILSNLPVLGTLDFIKPSWLIYGFIRPLCILKDQHRDCVPHVDDIPLTRNNLEMIKATKRYPFHVFEMKDIGETRHVLGVEIIQSRPKKRASKCLGTILGL